MAMKALGKSGEVVVPARKMLPEASRPASMTLAELLGPAKNVANCRAEPAGLSLAT